MGELCSSSRLGAPRSLDRLATDTTTEYLSIYCSGCVMKLGMRRTRERERERAGSAARQRDE